MRTQFICLGFVIIFLCPYTSAQWVQTSGTYARHTYALAVSGTNLFVGTLDGVFLCTNDGLNWIEINAGLTEKAVTGLVASGTTLFARTFGGRAFLSTDNGTNWTRVSSLPANTYVSCVAISGTNLFAGSAWDTTGDAFLSTDNGTSWTPVNSGLPLKTPVYTLTISGTNLFVGTRDGFFLSTDNGTSWTLANSGLPLKNSFTLTISGTNLFAGFGDGGIFLSTDNGTSWTQVNSLPTNLVVNCFAIIGTNLFASTGYGVFLSTNNGGTWTAVNNGLTSANIRALAVSGTNLFAGSEPGGVWRRPLAEMITTVESPSGLPEHFSVEQNYPNPFNPSTTIKYKLPKSSEVKLSVYDMLGREASILVNERREAGVHEVKFDGANLASGVYVYRLAARDFVQSRTLIILK